MKYEVDEDDERKETENDMGIGKNKGDSDEDDDEEEEQKKTSAKPQKDDKGKPFDKEFKKILNEIEIRTRKEDPPDIKDKRARKALDNHRVRKLVSLVGKG